MQSTLSQQKKRGKRRAPSPNPSPSETPDEFPAKKLKVEEQRKKPLSECSLLKKILTLVSFS